MTSSDPLRVPVSGKEVLNFFSFGTTHEVMMYDVTTAEKKESEATDVGMPIPIFSDLPPEGESKSAQIGRAHV